MSIVAAVKKAIGYESDYWKLHLDEPAQEAHYRNTVLQDRDAWSDAFLMRCATKYKGMRRIYQNKPVLDI